MWGAEIQDDYCWYWGTDECHASEAEAYAACADFMLRNKGADMRRQYDTHRLWLTISTNRNSLRWPA